MLVTNNALLSYLSPPTTVNNNKGKDSYTDASARFY
jgi:hypothetical protein